MLGPAIFSLSAVVSLQAGLLVFLLFLICLVLLQNSWKWIHTQEASVPEDSQEVQ